MNQYKPETVLGFLVSKVQKNGFVKFDRICRPVDKKTKLYIIIGKGHLETKARFFHESININFDLNQNHLDPVEIEQFDKHIINDITKLEMRGVTVTIPFKEEAYKFISENGRFGDKNTSIAGAVNTIIIDNGSFIGWNTDIVGFLESLKMEGVKINGITALIAGCGGMGRAAVTALCQKKASKINLFDVDKTKSSMMYKEFSYRYPEIKFNICRSTDDYMRDSKLLVQCSPVGMKNYNTKEKTVFSNNHLKRSHVVFDTVYVPLETQLIKDAKNKGAKTISGMEMVIWGGMRQIQLYSGLMFGKKTLHEMSKVGRQALIKSFNSKNN